MTKYKRSHERDSLRGMLLFLTSFACAMYPPSRARPGVGTWWTKIFQSFELKTDAYALSFYHTLAQIPGMMLATGLIDAVGRRRLIIVGFGGGSLSLFLLSVIANAIRSSKDEDGDHDPTTGDAVRWHRSAIVFTLV